METQHNGIIAHHRPNSGIFVSGVNLIKSWYDNRVIASEIRRIDHNILKDIGLERCRVILLSKS